MIIINSKSYKTYKFDEINKYEYFGFVYITINKLDGKKYVGQHSRWKENYLGSGYILKSSIKKYGRENFERHIIYLAKSQEELNKMESYYINEGFGINTAKSLMWYNIKDGSQKGGNTFAGKTEDEMKKIGKKISEYQKSRKKTEEEKVKLSKSLKGRLRSEETKKKMSESKKGKNNHQAKPVILFKHEKYFGEYETIFDCAKTLGAETIGSAIYVACQKMKRGWKPPRRSKWYGWTIIPKEEYKKQ